MRKSVFAALLLTGCLEVPGPLTLDDPFEGEDSGQLTFSVHHDHAPVWSRSSDTIYYGTRTFPGMPPGKGLLLATPRDGGTAKPILLNESVAQQRQPWLAGLAVTRDGNNAAFFELTQVQDEQFDRIDCPVPEGNPPYDTAGTASFLRQAVLRVQPVSASAAIPSVASLTVNFAGRSGDDTGGTVSNTAYPFHRMFEQEGIPFFRPSWSPDGKRIVFSDGMNLRIWTVGETTAPVLAGAEEGVMPSWSPDGNWIAFSRPFKGRTVTFTCWGYDEGSTRPRAVIGRTVYTPYVPDAAKLYVIRPDGTGLRDLGIGASPTWTLDSQTLIAHRDENLYRIPISGTAATLIPDTRYAFEPAISPDGRFLAFARFIETRNYDIWVAPF